MTRMRTAEFLKASPDHLGHFRVGHHDGKRPHLIFQPNRAHRRSTFECFRVPPFAQPPVYSSMPAFPASISSRMIRLIRPGRRFGIRLCSGGESVPPRQAGIVVRDEGPLPVDHPGTRLDSEAGGRHEFFIQASEVKAAAEDARELRSSEKGSRDQNEAEIRRFAAGRPRRTGVDVERNRLASHPGFLQPRPEIELLPERLAHPVGGIR